MRTIIEKKGIRSFSIGTMIRVVNGKFTLWEDFIPVVLSMLLEHAKCVFHQPVNSFRLAIGLRVMGSAQF